MQSEKLLLTNLALALLLICDVECFYSSSLGTGVKLSSQLDAVAVDSDIGQQLRTASNSGSTTLNGQDFMKGDASKQIQRNDVSVSPSPREIRIRSLRKNDIETVAQILAEASVEENKTIVSQWFLSLELAKSKHMFINQLTSRFGVLEEAKKQKDKYSNLCNGETENESRFHDPSGPYVLWQSDVFRDKLKKATSGINDNTPWKAHDFTILQPVEEQNLRHTMIVAQDLYDGKVVGFVEVAMMPKPYYGSSRNSRTYSGCTPTIGNLVIKPTHRRRGIAKQLMRTAMRHVSICWLQPEEDTDFESSPFRTIGLYVKQDNGKAKQLYKKYGFSGLENVDCSMTGTEFDHESDALTYLERPLYAVA